MSSSSSPIRCSSSGASSSRPRPPRGRERGPLPEHGGRGASGGPAPRRPDDGAAPRHPGRRDGRLRDSQGLAELCDAIGRAAEAPRTRPRVHSREELDRAISAVADLLPPGAAPSPVWAALRLLLGETAPALPAGSRTAGNAAAVEACRQRERLEAATGGRSPSSSQSARSASSTDCLERPGRRPPGSMPGPSRTASTTSSSTAGSASRSSVRSSTASSG